MQGYHICVTHHLHRNGIEIQFFYASGLCRIPTIDDVNDIRTYPRTDQGVCLYPQINGKQYLDNFHEPTDPEYRIAQIRAIGRIYASTQSTTNPELYAFWKWHTQYREDALWGIEDLHPYHVGPNSDPRGMTTAEIFRYIGELCITGQIPDAVVNDFIRPMFYN